jgi:hypothetical protein
MKALLHLVICYVLLSYVAFAQIKIPEQVRLDLRATIESEAARAAKGIRVIDHPLHATLLGPSIVFDDYKDGLSVQIAYDKAGAPPGFRICWRSVKDGVPFDNELAMDSKGQFEYAVINGLEYDRNQRLKQPKPVVETVALVAEQSPPRALLVDPDTGELEPTELTQLVMSKEFSRLRTEIVRRIRDAPARPIEKADPAPQMAEKKKKK